jgi:hypothetical protein
MKTIDDNLLNGKYGYVYTDRKIDVLANKGLLYINRSLIDNDTNRAAQYNNTVDIMRAIYLGRLGGPNNYSSDNIFFDSHHVSSVSMQPISAATNNYTKGMSNATKAIWDHVNNYHQPAVVVVDSNKQDGNTTRASYIEPTLHQLVIRGIYEESSGGTRRFYVYDPAIYRDRIYSESDLRKLIALPYNTPAWIERYGNQKVGYEPAYILTVQGD